MNNLNQVKDGFFLRSTDKNIMLKINNSSKMLGMLPAIIGRGSSSGNDSIFILRRNGKSYQTRFGEKVEIEEGILRRPLYATDFNRYHFQPKSDEVIIFPYEIEMDGYSLYPEEFLLKKYPLTYKYLLSKKKDLQKRKQFKTWYSFSAPRNLDGHEKAQFLVPLLAEKGSFCRIEKNYQYCLMASGGFSITIDVGCQMNPN